MNDLDLVRDLRAGVPEPHNARLAAGRARLTLAIRSGTGPVPARSRVVRLNRPAVILSAGVVAVAVAAGAIAAVAASGGTSNEHRARPAALPAVAPAVLAAKVLRTAASVAARSRAPEPRPGQWFYSKTVGYEFGQVPATRADLEWGTFSGRYSAYYQSGRLIVHFSPIPAAHGGTALDRFDSEATPQTAYAALASLPSNPRALLAVIAAQVTKIGAANVEAGSGWLYEGAGASHADFDYLGLLMWNAADGQPPAAEASVYRAMADIPGVGVQPGITDAAGQPATAISDDGGLDDLLVNPQTFAVIGIRTLSTGASPARTVSGGKIRDWPAKGAVVESIAIVRVVPVSGPGRR